MDSFEPHPNVEDGHITQERLNPLMGVSGARQIQKNGDGILDSGADQILRLECKENQVLAVGFMGYIQSRGRGSAP